MAIAYIIVASEYVGDDEWNKRIIGVFTDRESACDFLAANGYHDKTDDGYGNYWSWGWGTDAEIVERPLDDPSSMNMREF